MRVRERAWLLPRLAEVMKQHRQAELAAKLEAIGLPFAPIAKPWDLLDDPHLRASGGLLETRIGNKSLHVPALPVALDGQRLPKRLDPPALGEHATQLLSQLGYSSEDQARLKDEGVVSLP
jgi:crotonobetainyl-CoA:carnitine CoA-transferase CaiB-like acyl-CoA transferase